MHHCYFCLYVSKTNYFFSLSSFPYNWFCAGLRLACKSLPKLRQCGCTSGAGLMAQQVLNEKFRNGTGFFGLLSATVTLFALLCCSARAQVRSNTLTERSWRLEPRFQHDWAGVSFPLCTPPYPPSSANKKS